MAKILISISDFYKDISKILLDSSKKILKENNLDFEQVIVPGAPRHVGLGHVLVVELLVGGVGDEGAGGGVGVEAGILAGVVEVYPRLSI